tara:strand:- start:143 stop:442 length:300 start_codon:yes stop_codon:yes gene_type:complete
MSFAEKVYGVVSSIPKGKVSTYKVVGKKLGSKAYRAVGGALRVNPNSPIVPCHRVVGSDGSLGGYAGKMASKKKVKLLAGEGVFVSSGKIVDFEKKLWK